MSSSSNPLRSEFLWSQVHALTVIAQLGSFTLAAQRLGLSKASVSQRVAELERTVGAPLLHRTTRSVRLTDAGRQLVDETAGTFAQIERSLEAVRDLAGEPRGKLRVTAPVALGRQHIAPALQEFMRRYPEIRIDLDLSDRLVPLARDGIDLAIRHTSTPPDSHVAWRLCDSRALLVAGTDYLRRRGIPEHPSELTLHDCVPYLRPGQSTWLFERAATGALGKPERVTVNVPAALRANNSEVVRDAVIAGMGIGLVPDFSVAAAWRAGHLREVLPEWRPVGFFGETIYALRHWSPATPRNVGVLVEHLQHRLRAGFLGPTNLGD
jgi:DNA-binding transcriptional LysR family regulator